MDQIRQYNPPPNPAKLSDSRAKKYIQEFGSSSWELDALEPRVLQKLIETHVEAFKDFEKWDERVTLHKEHKEQLSETVNILNDGDYADRMLLAGTMAKELSKDWKEAEENYGVDLVTDFVDTFVEHYNE